MSTATQPMLTTLGTMVAYAVLVCALGSVWYLAWPTLSDRSQWPGHGSSDTSNHPLIIQTPEDNRRNDEAVVDTAKRLSFDGSPAAILAFLKRDGSSLTADGIGILAGRGAERALTEMRSFPARDLTKDQQQRLATLATTGISLAKKAESAMSSVSSDQRSAVESTDLADTANKLIVQITEAMQQRGLSVSR